MSMKAKYLEAYKTFDDCTLCDSLKARLNDAQATQTHFADAIVEQAVA